MLQASFSRLRARDSGWLDGSFMDRAIGKYETGDHHSLIGRSRSFPRGIDSTRMIHDDVDPPYTNNPGSNTDVVDVATSPSHAIHGLIHCRIGDQNKSR